MRWLGVIVVVGCSQPPAIPGAAPEAPVIIAPVSSRDAPLRDRELSLVVEAPVGTTVRLFPSRDCRGPELLRDDAATAREGLRVELVYGENVFSAHAVSPEGRASSCSLPVTVVLRFPLRGDFPSPVVTAVLPRNPSQQRQVRLRGISSEGWTVTVWSQPACQGDVVTRGSASQFEAEGLPLELPFDSTLATSLDAARGDDLSRCSVTFFLTHDGSVPDVSDAFLFPQPPHPWSIGTLVVPGQRRNHRLEVFEGRDCVGRALQPPPQQRCPNPNTPDECFGIVYPLAFEATPVVSLRAVSPFGNPGGCVTLGHTPSLEPPTPFVATRFGSDGGSVVVASGTDPFPPLLSNLERCESVLGPAVIFQTRGAPIVYLFHPVSGPLWLRRQAVDGTFRCEPFPP